MAPVLERASPGQVAKRPTATNGLIQEKQAFALVHTLISVSVSAFK